MGGQVIEGFGVMIDFVMRVADGFAIMTENIGRAIDEMKEFLGLKEESENGAVKDLVKRINAASGASPNGTQAGGLSSGVQAPGTMTGATAGVGDTTNSRTSVSNTRVDRPVVNVNGAGDPERVGESVARHLTRAGQKAYR
jgi:hypothetical protein